MVKVCDISKMVDHNLSVEEHNEIFGIKANSKII